MVPFTTVMFQDNRASTRLDVWLAELHLSFVGSELREPGDCDRHDDIVVGGIFDWSRSSEASGTEVDRPMESIGLENEGGIDGRVKNDVGACRNRCLSISKQLRHISPPANSRRDLRLGSINKATLRRALEMSIRIAA